MRKPRESSLSRVIYHICSVASIPCLLGVVSPAGQGPGSPFLPDSQAQIDPQSEYHHLNRPCLFLFFQESLLQPLRGGFQSQHRWGASSWEWALFRNPSKRRVAAACPLPSLGTRTVIQTTGGGGSGRGRVGGWGGVGRECGQTSSVPLLCNIWRCCFPWNSVKAIKR